MFKKIRSTPLFFKSRPLLLVSIYCSVPTIFGILLSQNKNKSSKDVICVTGRGCGKVNSNETANKANLETDFDRLSSYKK
jgi:hypothetical protein